MLLIGGIIVLIILVVIAMFAFPILSPIPYFPSNKKDFPHILDALHLRNNQKIIDLGAGDGVIIFEAAKRAHKKGLNNQFVAVEINPILIAVMYIRRLFHSNKKNILILNHDLFTFQAKNESTEITYYLYVSPWFLEKIYANLKKNSSHFSIVSYFYEIPSLKPKKVIQGEHKIFVY